MHHREAGRSKPNLSNCSDARRIRRDIVTEPRRNGRYLRALPICWKRAATQS